MVADRALQRRRRHVRNRPGLDATAALDQRDDRNLVRMAVAARTLHAFFVTRFPADVGFVHHDDTFKQTLQWVLRHGEADAVAQMPSRAIGAKAKLALQL